MTTTLQQLRTPPLWVKCLLASLVLHSAVLYVVVKNPIILSGSFEAFFPKNKPIPTFINADKEWDPDTLVLQHFFEEIPSLTRKPFLEQKDFSLVPLEETGKEIHVTLSSPRLLKDLSLKRSEEMKSPTFVETEEKELLSLISPPLPPTSLIKASNHSVTHDFSVSQRKPPSKALWTDDFSSNFTIGSLDPSKESQEKFFEFSSKDLLVLNENSSSISQEDRIFPKTEHVMTQQIFQEKAPSFHFDFPSDLLSSRSMAEIGDYLSDDLLSAIEWNDDFQVNASFFPEKGGYVFSLSVEPNHDFQEQRIKQNFYFLIDASSDIEKHKLSVFKRSVLKSLSTLQPGDSFNILLLDKKVTKLSSKNLELSPRNVHLAEEFLEKGGERPLFSSLNLYKSLNEVLGLIEENDEVHTALLLTNGKSSLDPKELRLFLEKNNGKINLFTAAVGQNNNLLPLDMISSFLGGKLLYSDTNAAFPRKLSTFLKNMQSPIAKDLSISVYPSNPKAHLQMSSSLTQLPNLYNKGSFVVMGKIDRLCDLHLVLQGKSATDQIFLKKIIPFEETSIPSQLHKKEWALQEKTDLYEKFLQDPKISLIKQAREVLKTVYGKAFAE